MKVSKVTINWKGLDRASVWNFDEPIVWTLSTGEGTEGKFWNFSSNGVTHYVNLGEARHVKVEEWPGRSDGEG